MSETHSTQPSDVSAGVVSRVGRFSLASIGVLCVGIGAVGVFVPGLPTTIFLIIAIACFARSCPRLERRLVRIRLFSPFLRVIDGSEPMSMTARLTSLILMWCFAGAAALGLLKADQHLLASFIAGAACVGTLAILRWKRAASVPASTESPKRPVIARSM